MYETWKNIRSDGPAPEPTKRTSATAKKRTVRTSKTSSSSGKRNTKRRVSTSVPHPESVGYPEESTGWVGPQQSIPEWPNPAADGYPDAADQQAPAADAVGGTEGVSWPRSFHGDVLADDTAASVPPPQADAYSQYPESNGPYLAPASWSYDASFSSPLAGLPFGQG